jgi:hypothetical protein
MGRLRRAGPGGSSVPAWHLEKESLMRRLFLGPLAVLVPALALLVAPYARAADLPYAGTWKIVLLDGPAEIGLWVVKISKDNKIDVVGAVPGWDTARFVEVKSDAKALRSNIQLPGDTFSLIIYSDKGKDKILRGSLRLRVAQFVRVRLEKTETTKVDPKTAKNLMAGIKDLEAAMKEKDNEEKIKNLIDLLKDHEGKPITYLTSQLLISLLVQKKAEAKEFKAPVKVYVDQVAEYGHEITVGAHLTLSQMLLAYEKTQEMALVEAKTAGDMLQETDPRGLQLAVYMALALALEKNKKSDQIKGVVAKISRSAEKAVEDTKEPAGKVGVAQLVAQLLLRSPIAAVADVGLEYARKAVAMAKDDKLPGQRLAAYRLLQQGLASRGKADEAKKLTPTIDKLESDIDAEYDRTNLPFKPEKFVGRKGKSRRVVLVELFTGAQCPPCIAADMAFDGALKSYPAKDVVFLQYHLHIPGPDPLTNSSSEARQEFYSDVIEGAPTAFVDGKVAKRPGEDGLGGFRDKALESYDALRKMLDKNLETDAAATIKLDAKRKGDTIDVAAEVSDLKETGDKVKLRFVLVEDVVRYIGRNQQRLHHHVVRDFPGGVDGFKLDKKSGKHTASIDLGNVRKKLNKYLADYATRNKERLAGVNWSGPMALKKLKVVAFIQTEGSRKVAQVAQCDVPEDETKK